jgi:hypothetical protein
MKTESKSKLNSLRNNFFIESESKRKSIKKPKRDKTVILTHLASPEVHLRGGEP